MFNIFGRPKLATQTNNVDSVVQNAYNLMQEERAFNSEEAQKNRDWQEYMSNTAYQRAFADMQSVGLNPYMLYSNGGTGASSPTGATASHSGISNTLLSALTSNINTLIKSQTSREIALMNNITNIFGSIKSQKYKGKRG